MPGSRFVGLPGRRAHAPRRRPRALRRRCSPSSARRPRPRGSPPTTGAAASASRADVSAERLSALDASFLAVEGAAAPMHVGWVARFDPPEDGPRPGVRRAVRAHRRAARARAALPAAAGGRAVRAPRPGVGRRPALRPRATTCCRPRARTSTRSSTPILSTPLRRDRPLWEICDRRRAARRAHRARRQDAPLHGRRRRRGRARQRCCSTPSPTGWTRSRRRRGWTAAPVAVGRRAARARASSTAPPTARRSRSRRRVWRALRGGCAGCPRAAARARARWRTTLLPPAPSSPLNRPGSPRRHHVRVTRSLDETARVRRRFGVTPQRRRARRLRRRAAALRGAPRGAAAAAEGDGPGRRAHEHGRRRHRQPHLVRVPRPALRRARPGRAARGHQPRDLAAGARRRGRATSTPPSRPSPARRARCSGRRPRLRAPAAVQPHDLERPGPGAVRATCAAAGCARSTPRCRSPAATRSRSASSRSPGRSASGSSPTPRSCPTPSALGRDLEAAFDELVASRPARGRCPGAPTAARPCRACPAR